MSNRWELQTRRDGRELLRGLPRWVGWGGGGNGVTGATSVRLLGIFLDHRRPQALLLWGVEGRVYGGACHIRTLRSSEATKARRGVAAAARATVGPEAAAAMVAVVYEIHGVAEVRAHVICRF